MFNLNHDHLGKNWGLFSAKHQMGNVWNIPSNRELGDCGVAKATPAVVVDLRFLFTIMSTLPCNAQRMSSPVNAAAL